MGTVYLAEQLEPVRRRVALKLIRSTLVNNEARLRFHAERQALARLSHPFVAQILEAGSTEGGHPYFVMEYIPGWPLTTYCDRRRLGLEDRLRLFRDVCVGVQHAHRKGVLHRDLKPSNVLVTELEERAIPKVIDFGIAKVLDSPLIDTALLTGNRMIGTPAYLSPEMVQQGAGRAEIDTRTDVYSAGILLYELLVGSRPIEGSGQSLMVLMKRITEEEPESPSQRWADLEDAQRDPLATCRDSEPAAYRKALRGDLDKIVLKAISKRPRDRYGTMSELSADIGRYLERQPIEARAPSSAYRLRKLAERHRLVVAALMAVVLAVVVGVAGLTIGLVKARDSEMLARREAAAAESVAEFLENMFTSSDPWRSSQVELSVRDVLDRGADAIESGLMNEPLVRARLLQTMGIVYRRLGEYDRAESLLVEAMSLRKAQVDRNLAETLLELGTVYRLQLNLKEAEPLLERAVTLEQEGGGESLARCLERLAGLRHSQTRWSEGEVLYRRALALRESIVGRDHESLIVALSGLGHLYRNQRRFEESLHEFDRVLAISELAYGKNHPTVATILKGIGLIYMQQDLIDESEPFFQRSLEILKATLAPDHPELGHAYGLLAEVESQRGDLEEAAQLFSRNLDIYERTYGRESLKTAWVGYDLGLTRLEQGLLEKANLHLLRAASIWESLGQKYAYPLALSGLGRVAHLQERYLESEEHYQRALEVFDTDADPPRDDLVKALEGYSALLRDLGREQEVLELEGRLERLTALED